MSDEAVVALTSPEVSRVFDDCIDNEDGDVEVSADVSIMRLAFRAEKIALHKQEIAAMLMDLPLEYRQSAGGGWSFLNACNDRYGTQWTGMQSQMACLFALGLAAGLVTCLIPRDMWGALPGSMPYYMVNDIKVSM